MSSTHIVSAEANVRAANVKPQSGGHSQNYMPPEAKDALDKAAKAKEQEKTK
jgi:cytochrome c-type biogenesis protein CcmE